MGLNRMYRGWYWGYGMVCECVECMGWYGMVYDGKGWMKALIFQNLTDQQSECKKLNLTLFFRIIQYNRWT